MNQLKDTPNALSKTVKIKVTDLLLCNYHVIFSVKSVGYRRIPSGILTFVHCAYRRTSLCIPGREREHNPNKWGYAMNACSICKSQE